MSFRSRSVSVTHFFQPLKTAAQRFAFSVLIGLSLLTLLVSKADPDAVERARIWAADVVVPALSVLRQPVAAVTQVGTRIHDMIDLYQENDRLRQENATLLEWQQVARQLANENEALRNLMHYRPPNTTWYVTSRVIGTAGGVFSRNLLIDRGSLDGVAEGQAALTGMGLIGRIAEVGNHAARVLLMTDLNSRIPVTIEPEHARAILAGDNTDQPQLIYVPSHMKPKPGDRVETSGDGGVFPPGLPVGVVSSTNNDLFEVQPYADIARADYLRIADFGLSGFLPSSAAPLPKPFKSRKAAHHGGQREERRGADRDDASDR
jgi:rod shape-determining protein MreC